MGTTTLRRIVHRSLYMEDKTVKWLTDDYSKMQVEMEVAEVKKSLMSVRRMTEAGNRVVFEPGNNYIENINTGKKTKIEFDGKAYMVPIWLPQPKGFQGQVTAP